MAIAEIASAAHDVTALHKPMPQMDQLENAHTIQVERRIQELRAQRERAVRAENEPQTSQELDDGETRRRRRSRDRIR